ncbi:hypothetical protein CLIT_10c02320 [Peptoclostridium litorale DSM 5388]|uniref:Uncharacterized protein n=1 Tax=Peptoclostridium litorale DSM 5388 TaxID=1121324 RepID=A0A069RH57_PEPLI|nr:hypothetical protein CLIT_10c02320 [Peptoclostridium litorale DSM 5388]
MDFTFVFNDVAKLVDYIVDIYVLFFKKDEFYDKG